MDVIRATENWQRAGAYYVRIQAMAKKHHITLRQEFDEHDTPETKYIVILDHDFPIATARMYELDSESVMIGRVVVLPEYRRQGIGTKVMRECEEWALDLGYRKTVIDSRDNKIAFYQQIGYKECGEPFIEGETFRCVRMEKILFARAMSEDVEYLRSLAHRSEAHWGYDQKFMDTFDSKFNITEKFILNHPVYVVWEKSIPTAFWGLRRDLEMWELEYFYVAEGDLGKGYGKQMWNHMTTWCKEHKIRKIHFVTSDQATGFYEKMGAIQDGTSRSMIDGRLIPHFVYELL